MKKIKRIILPLTIFASLSLASCRTDLATNYSKDDLDIDTEYVDFNIPPTGINFASGEENLYIERGETHQYQYAVTPEGASAALLNWTSSNESVATISSKGLLTAVSGGETQITIKEENNAFAPVILSVHVTVEITSFDVSLDSYELDWNKEYTFNQSFTPSDTTWTNLNWSIPEEEQHIATIADGVLSTYQETGIVHLTVTSDRLQDYSKQIELHVADRKIHVESINLSLENDELSRIEIGESSKVVAVVNPSNAEDAGTLKYYSRHPEIASIDPDSGLITALNPGTAKIFANCEGVDSNDVEIEVYEVYATSIAFDKTSDIIVTNEENGSKQLQINIGVSELGKTKPSRETPTYSVKYEDRDVVSVTSEGVISALKSGTATVEVSIKGQGDNVYSDSITVTSKAYVNNITISGPISAYLDETATLVATTSPSPAEDEIISWSINPSEKVSAEINNNEITLTPLMEGPVTVTATSSQLGVSTTHTISFNEKIVEFETGEIYLVGDKQFNTGESIVGQASWTNAKYALKLVNSSSDDTSVSRQVTARVSLHRGDLFKLREGPLNTGWKDLFYYDDTGAKIWNYEQAGAIDNIHLKAGSSPDGNIEVLKDGVYDIYYKDLVSGGYRIYIGLAPTIHFDKTELSMGITSKTTLTLHEYNGEVSAISSDNNIVTISTGEVVENVGIQYEITAVGVGNATITATDSLGKVATCVVTVREDTGGVTMPIYLNANGIFDSDGALPFVHAFSSTTPTAGHRDLALTLVNGQTLIYTVEIPEEYDSAIFVRMPSGSTSLDWETAWNQTKDSDALFNDNNMFTITGFDAEDGKYLTGTWSTFDPEIIYKIPADYYLAGSFNNWSVADEDYALSKVGDGHYQIENVSLTAGDAVKVVDKSGDHWFTNAGVYEGCGYTLVDDGHGGENVSLNATGTYKIDFYVVDEYGTDNHIVFDIDGGDDPQPQVTSYYLKGDFNEWDSSDSYLFTKVDDNHYVLNDVEIHANEGMKGWGSDNTWYGVGNEGQENLVATQDGIYKVDLYLVSEYNNHLVLTRTGDIPGGDDPIDPPEPSTIKTFYFTNNKGWGSLKAYVWNKTSGAKPAEWPGVDMTYVYTNDMGEAVYSIEIDTALYDCIIFNSGDIQTVDIPLSAFGDNNACYISGGSGNAHTVGYWNYAA